MPDGVGPGSIGMIARRQRRQNGADSDDLEASGMRQKSGLLARVTKGLSLTASDRRGQEPINADWRIALSPRRARAVAIILWLSVLLATCLETSGYERSTALDKAMPLGFKTVLAGAEELPELSIEAGPKCASTHPVVGTVARITGLAWKVRRSRYAVANS
jgi:hypothetical protein